MRFPRTVSSLILGTALAAPGFALAQAAAPAAPASPHTITGNVGLFSQYIFRGLTQTNREPAIQGGLDYAHSSGFYAGTWASNISWLRDGTPQAYSNGGSMEWDFYGGMKGTFGKSDFTWDVGGLYYWYPGSSAAGFVKADNFEVYGAVGWKWLSAKLNYTLSNRMFGVRDANGTYYLDLSANFPVTDKLTLNAHWGYQKYTGRDAVGNAAGLSNDRQWSYKDVKLGLTYALPKDFSIGAFYSKAYDADPRGYGNIAQGGVYPRPLGDSTVTVFIQKTF